MVVKLQHVSLPIPPESHADVRAFYASVLGLQEIPIPASIAHLKVLWFRAGEGDLELHFLQDSLPNPEEGRHVGLVVDDLAACKRRLDEAGYHPYETVPIPHRPRFFCRDPFGNLLEFLEIRGDYREGDVTLIAKAR
jgi:catechol 2,3-dioxygenase-like lactoylglutathione lyase family enzyme